MDQLSDKELIKNHTVFFAYLCHLIESNLADDTEQICDIGWKLEEEIIRRKISDDQIKKCINRAILNPEDQCMVAKYIYPGSDLFKTIGDS